MLAPILWLTCICYIHICINNTNTQPFCDYYTGHPVLASRPVKKLCWSKVLLPAALADGYQCIEIWEKTLEFSSMVT